MEAARRYLSETEKQFVQLYYDDRKSIRKISEIMAYGTSAPYKIRQEVIRKTARFFGIL